MSHQIITNIFLNPMKEGEDIGVEVGLRKLYLIRLVTTKSEFVREEGTRLVTYHNSTLDIGMGGGGGINPQDLRERPYCQCREFSWD